jgi:hypothetical protein
MGDEDIGQVRCQEGSEANAERRTLEKAKQQVCFVENNTKNSQAGQNT